MHRAFDSEDIIYSVLNYLKRKDFKLKNVAMTCSSLAAPALDFLWSEHSSLAPLIMCLPSDTLEITDRTIVSEVYHLNLDLTMLTMLSNLQNLTGEPTPNEWARVRLNASRVRRISDWDPVSYNFFYPKLRVSGLVLRKLFEQFPPTTLFPNLYAFGSHALRESSSDLSLV